MEYNFVTKEKLSEAGCIPVVECWSRIHKAESKSGMVEHCFNLSIWKTEAEDWEFNVTLIYLVSLRLA